MVPLFINVFIRSWELWGVMVWLLLRSKGPEVRSQVLAATMSGIEYLPRQYRDMTEIFLNRVIPQKNQNPDMLV